MIKVIRPIALAQITAIQLLKMAIPRLYYAILYHIFGKNQLICNYQPSSVNVLCQTAKVFQAAGPKDNPARYAFSAALKHRQVNPL